MSVDDRRPEQDSQELLNEAEALIWGLLDENIDAASSQRLEKLMSNELVRKRYVQCVELHSDLQQLFADPDKKPSARPASPVLGNLSNVYPPFPCQPGASAPPPLPE